MFIGEFREDSRQQGLYLKNVSSEVGCEKEKGDAIRQDAMVEWMFRYYNESNASQTIDYLLIRENERSCVNCKYTGGGYIY